MKDIHAIDAQGFIPGVYNYCDRRCERCRFVRQCRVGIVDVDDIGEAEDAVGSGKVEDMKERLHKLMSMPPKSEDDGADEDLDDDDDESFNLDFDPNDLEPDPDYEKEQAEIRRKTKEHPLTNMGSTYTMMVGEWLKPREAGLKASGVSLYRTDELGFTGARTPESLVLSEALDEILWFKYMLHIKCQRAVSGKIEDPDWLLDMGIGPIQSDWNGTAKLAIEIVQRCQQAWTTVAELLPETADDIMPILELLRRIGEELKKEFPDTERFVRAGWDAPREPEWEAE
jgi:hypothetical protein